MNKLLIDPFFQNFYADIQLYKANIDQFNELTQTLISAYPNDDATKINKAEKFQENLNY